MKLNEGIIGHTYRVEGVAVNETITRRLEALGVNSMTHEVIGFRNVDMAELLIHTLTERVAITEGHLFRVAFAIFFQLSQAAEFQDVPLFPGVFFLPGNKKRVRRGVNVDISGTPPASSSLWFSAPIIC